MRRNRTMKKQSPLKRWLALGTTATVFSLALGVAVWPGSRSTPSPDQALAEQAKEDMKRVWPLFGGSLGRNMVNAVDRNIASEWQVAWDESVDPKVYDRAKSKNIKWVAKLGTIACGGPRDRGGQGSGRHEQWLASRPEHQGRQGHPDVLPRVGWRLPLAGSPRQARFRRGE